jgi:hypothetical protein
VRPLQFIVYLWGVGGVLALLTNAIVRLAPIAFDAITSGLTPTLWVACALWLLFMGVGEGYRGFQKQFSPRVAKRAMFLSLNPQLPYALLAPVFCMGLIGATRKRLAVSWSVVTMVTGFIFAVPHLAQPFRGIVDAGVVLGLAWGVVATLVFAVQTALGNPPEIPADVPAGF